MVAVERALVEPASRRYDPRVTMTPKQTRKLRALGHHLEPVVMVGKGGVTEQVIAAVHQALDDHELIKVKINEEHDQRTESAAALAKATGAQLAQLVGKMALLFRKREEDSKFPGF
jgi:RNA-binding protein